MFSKKLIDSQEKSLSNSDEKGFEDEEPTFDEDDVDEAEAQEKLPGNIKNLISLAIQFKQNVSVGTEKRMRGLKRHKQVFVGRKAVDWLVSSQGITREEAVVVGEILRAGGLFRSIKDDAPFNDSKDLYGFREENRGTQFTVPDEVGSSSVETFTGIFKKLRLSEDAFKPSKSEDGPKYEIQAERGLTPLVVFINKKSGGQQGKALEAQFSHLLCKHQVFDLSEGGPLQGLTQFKDVEGHMILGCGGDGTIGWILSTMDKIKYTGPVPPVAILPLGTGNDIARVTGWGAGYKGQKISTILTELAGAEVRDLDRWKIEMKQTSGEHKVDKHVMNNYMSFGFDAHIALEFHEARNAHPGRFASRNVNKLWYVRFGASSMISGSKDLSQLLQVRVDGKKLRIKGVGALVVLNISSYSAGADIWGSAQSEKFSKPGFDDGKLEVVGIKSSFHMGKIQTKAASGIRLAQGSKVTIRYLTENALPVQVDGEPWRQPPSVVKIRHHNKARMLCRKEEELCATAIDYTPSSEELEKVAAAIVSPLFGPRVHLDVLYASTKPTLTGSQIVDWLLYFCKLEDRRKAWKVGSLLLEKEVFQPANDKSKVFYDKNTQYLLLPPKEEEETPLPEVSSPFVAVLRVNVVEGKGIPVKKAMKVKVEVEHQAYSTSCASDKEHPVWGEQFVFVVTQSSAILKASIKKVGSVFIPVSVLVEDPKREGLYALLPTKATKMKVEHVGELRLHTTLEFARSTIDKGFYNGPIAFRTHHAASGKIKRAGQFISSGKVKLSKVRNLTNDTGQILRTANHRCCVNLMNLFTVHSEKNPASRVPAITAKFEYGIHDKKNSDVEVFIQDTTDATNEWVSLGVHTTDSNGEINVPLEEKFSSKAGYYRVRCVVLEDNSIAAGQLFILERGTGAIVFDMDGTITIGDQEVVKQFFADSAGMGRQIDLQERDGSISMVRAWVARGYLPVYLSGRQGSFYNLTREWLVKHGFPPGPVQLTDTHMPTLPLYSSVGNFKVNYMKYLMEEVGVKIAAVYGNTKTDIKAYAEVGMPKEVTFISGSFGGNDSTIDVGNDFVEHVETVLAFPAAEVPAVNACLKW